LDSEKKSSLIEQTSYKIKIFRRTESANSIEFFFHAGKTEKLVYQGLSELDLPSGKNESIPKADFTFDKFYELYHKICPRNDIEELFRSM
jgi:hypothetical protein